MYRQAELFLESPARTYDTYSTACRESTDRAEWAGEVMAGLAMFEAFFGVPFSELEIGDVLVRNVTETEGEAYVELLDPDGNPIGEEEYESWVYEDGNWRSNDCDLDGDDTGPDGDVSDDSSPVETIAGDLRPADEVTEERDRADAAVGTVGGDALDLGGIDVSVAAIRFSGMTSGDGTDNEYMVAVELRAENRTTDDLVAPEFQVRCANGAEGSWYMDSTYPMYDDLPSGTFAEGVLVLGVPVGCQDPVVRGSDWDSGDTAIWQFPAGVAP